MLAKTMTLPKAQALAGKVSTGNSKMPGSTFAITTAACKTGAVLAEIKGSVCHRCYAKKLEKMRPNLRKSYTSNYEKAMAAIAKDPVEWAEAMAFQINLAALSSGEFYHRWFDFGDLQSVEMLYAINLVCEKTPQVQHWLPTREAKLVDDYAEKYHRWLAPNLTVRVSSVMIDDKPIMRWANTSTVHSKSNTPQGSHVCPARDQGNACGECRACWDREVLNVSYPLH